MGKATQDLRKDHDAILYVFTVMDKIMAADTIEDAKTLQFGTELVYFLKIFADKCHHGKEENLLFPELVRKGLPNEGGPVGAMLQDHRQGREYISSMSIALESKDLIGFKKNAGLYRDFLINHIGKENNVLFMMADKLIDDQKQDELYKKFGVHEESVIGHGIHEELHAMIHQWEESFSS